MNEEVRDKARALGLDRLTEKHLTQFERATVARTHLPATVPVVWTASGEE
jgi:hypothetical protein